MLKKSIRSIKRKFGDASIILNRKFHLQKFSLPDFLIVGAQKSGTTALYSYLIQHPGIISASQKEIHYFGNPYNRMKGTYWYTTHFCKASRKKSMEKNLGFPTITGEATPYMHKPYLPKYVFELLPSIKLIALFRDPIDRAYSQYHHQCRNGREKLSFKEAIAESPVQVPEEQMNDEWLYYNNNLRSYITRGLYAEHLERWYQYYPKDRIHIIHSKDFFADPLAELKKVLCFLEMPDYKFEIMGAIFKGNYKTEIDADTREYLVSVFRPYNQRLFEMIGRDFGWSS